MNTEMHLVKMDDKGNFGLWLQHQHHTLTQEELNALSSMLDKHVLTPLVDQERFFSLPYGTVISIDRHKGGQIASNLKSWITRGRADALESFLLALACEGVDLDLRFEQALETTVDAILNHTE